MTVQQHAMELIGASASGEEEWFCPHCQKRLHVTWPEDLAQEDLFVCSDGEGYLITTGSVEGARAILDMLAQAHDGDVVHHFVRDAEVARAVRQDVAMDCPLSLDMRRWLIEAGFERWWHDEPGQLAA